MQRKNSSLAEQTKNIDSDNQIVKDDEIDLIEVAKTVWAGRKLILKVTAVFFVIGVIIAFGSKVEYEASCKLMPETQEGMKPNLGGLGSLAGLAGINLDLGGNGALTPELYPEIAQSVPFLLKVWNEPIHFEKQDTVISTYQFFKEIDRPSIFNIVLKYTLYLPFQVKNWLTDTNLTNTINSEKVGIIRMNKDDSDIFENLKSRINVNVDPKTGVINLSTLMPDALAAAELAQVSIKILTDHITSYKISKTKVNFEFIKDRFEDAKQAFEKAQNNLASFSDRNQNVVTFLAKTELEQLQNEYNIHFEVYKDLAIKLEQSEIALKENTPIFTILEPVVIPNEKIKPLKIKITIIYTFVGFIFSIVFIILKHFVEERFFYI